MAVSLTTKLQYDSEHEYSGPAHLENAPEQENIRRPLRFSLCLYNLVHPRRFCSSSSHAITSTLFRSCYHQTSAQPTTPVPTRHPSRTLTSYNLQLATMSANTQTLAGPASEPSASRADTTSASAGRKRKTPVRPSELASNGGDGWTLDLVSYTPSIMRYVETDHVHRNVSSGRLGGRRGLASPTERLAISLVAARQPVAAGSVSFARSTRCKVMKKPSDSSARLALRSRPQRRSRERTSQGQEKAA
jgi:hypothetical protein